MGEQVRIASVLVDYLYYYIFQANNERVPCSTCWSSQTLNSRGNKRKKEKRRRRKKKKNWNFQLVSFHLLFFGMPMILDNHMPLLKMAFTGNISKSITSNWIYQTMEGWGRRWEDKRNICKHAHKIINILMTHPGPHPFSHLAIL